jgi:class 3 adenylate cyclase
LQTGANDYVTKPIDFPVVMARVNTQLKLKQANDRVRALAAELETRNEFIRSVFGRYLTDDIAEALLDSPEGLALGGERREMSILMADIRGFTRLSAQRDPEEVVKIVNNFLSPMTEVILRHGGTIDEFIGDAILVLFGAPRAMEDHAARAVACAIEMQLAMPQVNELNRQAGLPEVATGIGINSGEVVVGNIGSEMRAKYGVVGHNVNFTARIESQTEGGQILVSSLTREICGGALTTGEEKVVHPKGFDEAVTVYEVCGIGEPFNLRLP